MDRKWVELRLELIEAGRGENLWEVNEMKSTGVGYQQEEIDKSMANYCASAVNRKHE